MLIFFVCLFLRCSISFYFVSNAFFFSFFLGSSALLVRRSGYVDFFRLFVSSLLHFVFFFFFCFLFLFLMLSSFLSLFFLLRFFGSFGSAVKVFSSFSFVCFFVVLFYLFFLMFSFFLLCSLIFWFCGQGMIIFFC